MKKQQTSYRISPEGKQLLAALSQRLGINQTAVIEMAVRSLAEREQVRQPQPQPAPP